MTDLLAARSQMAMSLAFHIVFACIGMTMPMLMVLSEWRYVRTRDPLWLELTRRWARGTAILFAVGAVSGTVLSFELGLLWPRFMEFAGPIIGMPFSLEGAAFFLEAILLGIYLYGWERLSPKLHLLCGVGVMVSGVASGAFVVTANAWMNTPTGFELVDGQVVDVSPIAAMLNPAAATQVLHMTVAAFQAVGFGVASVHAAVLLKRPGSRFHRAALSIAFPIAAAAALVQPLVGDLSAEHVAHYQPVKLAALEGQWQTERGAPLRIGGWPDEEAEVTRYALEIPKLLSILAFADPNAEVAGLTQVAAEDRPPVAVVHIAFQIMVAIGTFLALLSIVGLVLWRRTGTLTGSRWLLRALVASGPLAFLAVEAGWTVTEVGRQPWVVYGLIRTADAVTPVQGLQWHFAAFSVLYLALAAAVFVLLRRHVFASLDEIA